MHNKPFTKFQCLFAAPLSTPYESFDSHDSSLKIIFWATNRKHPKVFIEKVEKLAWEHYQNSIDLAPSH